MRLVRLCESKLNELQKPLSHYKNVLKGKWNVPDQLMDYFVDNGYECIGSGFFSMVWSKPGENFVLKLMIQEVNKDCYIDYAEFIRKHPNKHFPKIGKPRQFKQENGDVWYIIPVERLEVAPSAVLRNRDEMALVWAFKTLQMEGSDREDKERAEDINQIFSKKFPELTRALYFIDYNFSGACDIDLHDGNIMLRGDTLVLTDPVSFKL